MGIVYGTKSVSYKCISWKSVYIFVTLLYQIIFMLFPLPISYAGPKNLNGGVFFKAELGVQALFLCNFTFGNYITFFYEE